MQSAALADSHKEASTRRWTAAPTSAVRASLFSQTNPLITQAGPGDGQVRPPMPPAFFFVIDVSQAAVASGVLAHVCRAIRSSLDRLPGGERTRIGFLTFDTALHFYNLKAGLTQPQMMARPTALKSAHSYFPPALPKLSSWTTLMNLANLQSLRFGVRAQSPAPALQLPVV